MSPHLGRGGRGTRFEGFRLLLWALLAALLGARGGSAGEAAVQEVDLLFASTREVADKQDPARFLGIAPGPLVFGRCTVAYAESPRAGRWSGYGDFLLPGDERHVADAGTFTRDGFVEALSAAKAKRVVLFVHGYSYGFGRGCRRVSDLQVVLGDSVRVVLFSWPSAGNPLRYEGDRQALSASVPALVSTLRLLAGVGAPRLAIAAHSMGAFGVMEALKRFETAEHGKLAADLVLIAPDVDVESFRAQFPSVRDRFGRVTLYTSAKDVLLGLSSLFNGGQRLGQGGDDALVLPGLETVDVSRVPRHHPAAHEYQYYNPHVVADLVELLRDGKGAAQRSGTTAREKKDLRYWLLSARDSGDPGETYYREGRIAGRLLSDRAPVSPVLLAKRASLERGIRQVRRFYSIMGGTPFVDDQLPRPARFLNLRRAASCAAASASCAEARP